MKNVIIITNRNHEYLKINMIIDLNSNNDENLVI